MSTTYVLSARAACSYIWNQGIDRKDYCHVNLLNSMRAFIIALFSDYAVTKADIDKSSLLEGDHNNSIFSKEYRKLSSYTSKPASVSTIETSNEIIGKSTNEHTTETQDQNAVCYDHGKFLESQEVDAIAQLNKRPKECISIRDFVDLAHHNNFKEGTHYIVKGSIDYLKCTTDEISNMFMPEYLTVEGDFLVSDNIIWNNFPKILKIDGSFFISCNGCNTLPSDLSKTIMIADSMITFRGANIKYPPHAVFVQILILSGCSSMVKLPQELRPNSELSINDCNDNITNHCSSMSETCYSNVKIIKNSKPR